MKKATVQASSDVALIKYWGKKDKSLRLPENGSISMILEGLDTITSVEFQTNLKEDEVTIQGQRDPIEVERVVQHLDRIRELAKVKIFAKVESKNTFPKGTGLSSSGSGFAALTLASAHALDLNLSERELSILARQGSGTACRCVCSGFVEWRDGDSSETSYSESIFPSDYFDIHDVIAVVSEDQKQVSSTEGHENARSSIFYEARLEYNPHKIEQLKSALRVKDFPILGEIIEAEALEFHSILLTSLPPLIAWYPGTIQVMHEVQQMRKEGIEAYFTINTGFNVHVLCLPKDKERAKARLEKLSLVQKVLLAKVGEKPRQLDYHLF